MAAVETDNNTFVTTGTYDETLRAWNKTTCECLRSVATASAVYSLIRTKDKLRIVCGMAHSVEIRGIDDLGVISSFKVRSASTACIYGLEDGSFVTTDYYSVIRFNESGSVLQSFDEHTGGVYRLIELNSDVIVASCRNNTVRALKLSTEECLYKSTLHSDSVYGLEKLSKDKFVTVSKDKTIRVWNGMSGECIEMISTCGQIDFTARVGDSIVTANRNRMEVWRLKYDFVFSSSPSPSPSFLSFMPF